MPYMLPFGTFDVRWGLQIGEPQEKPVFAGKFEGTHHRTVPVVDKGAPESDLDHTG